MNIWQEMQWDAAPTLEEAHADHLAAIWAQADAAERRVILRERIAAARARGDSRCPSCDGHRRAACATCGGSGYTEPALRALTAMEEEMTVMLKSSRPGIYRIDDRAVALASPCHARL